MRTAKAISEFDNSVHLQIDEQLEKGNVAVARIHLGKLSEDVRRQRSGGFLPTAKAYVEVGDAESAKKLLDKYVADNA